MPGRNHVASAVLAASASRSGAASVSPLVQSYQQFDVNRPYGPALPRTPDAFTSGMFGPLSPIVPMGIDKPREDSGRPAPRRWQYPVGWNLPVGTPGTEGIKMTTFATLRSLADMYSVVRTCIDKRIAELVALDWDIVPTAEADRAMRGDSDKRTDWDKRRAQVIDFFTSPDSDRAKYPTFESWLSALLEDLFVLDAVALHLHPPRRPNSGPFHSDLASLDLLDGSTIRPLLNMHGSTPRPPDVAYQQYIWGVPRVDLSSVVQGVDVEGMTDQKVAEYRADQLMYLRFKARNWTPYGFSPVEASLLPISIGLARQQFQWDYFQDGSIPGQFVVPGDSVTTPQQIRELQDALNALAGDIGAKHRIIVLPPGSKADAQKSPELTDQFDEWVLSLVTMLFQLTPMDIGITPRARAMMSPEGGRQMAMTNSTQGNQTRVKPITTWLKAVLFDYIIQNVFGQDDMEWSWGITATGENAEQELDMTVQKVQNGILSIDEARISQGEAPWGLPESSVPIVWTGTGPVLLSSIGQAAAQPAIPGDVRHQITAPKPANPGPKLPMPLAANPEDEGTPAHTAATRLPNTAGPHPEPAKDTAETDKAILQAELQKLTRYLRKGKPIDRFVSKVLTDQQLQQGQQPADNGDTAAAVAAVAAAALIAQSVARRAAAVSSVATQVADTIGQLVNRYRNGDVAYPTAVDQGVAALTDGYRTSMADGTRHAADDSGLAVININHEAETRGEAQRGYITRLLGAGDAATPARLEAMASRFDLYGATLTGAYNSAYGATIRQGAPDRRIVWRLGETEHCPLCLERDGKEFTFDTLPGWPGDGGFGGPLCEGGPNCFPAGTEVQSADTEIGYDRWYEGDLVEIVTAEGRQLSGTPNHPVLTCRGWVPLGMLQEGDHLIGGSFVQPGTVDPHVQAVPTGIEQVVDALADVGTPVWSSVLPMDFHGDGAGSSQVKIVGADGQLLDGSDAAGDKPLRKFRLSGADVGQEALSALRHADTVAFGSRSAAGRGVGGSDLVGTLLSGEASPILSGALSGDGRVSGTGSGSPAGSLIGGDGPVAGQVGFPLASDMGAVFGDDAMHQPHGDAEAVGDVLSTVALDVTIDKVIFVERRAFAGHVYNLQTRAGWYVANGLIVHNCGCWLEFVENNQAVDIGTNTQRPDSVQYYAEQNDRIAAARAQAAADRRAFLSTIPGDAAARAAARDDVRQQLSAIANRMIRQSGGYPGVTVEPTDIPADLVAALSKSGDNPAEVAFEASLIASVPEDDWEWIGKLWDPDLHPRDVRGRFVTMGDVSHAESQARTRAPDVVDTRSRRQHRRDLEDAFGGHHDTGETIRPDTAQLPTDRAMAPTEHVAAATGDHDRFVSVKALADQARRSNLYTDAQVRVALDKLEQLRHQAETDKDAERRKAALIGIGAILAGFLVAVFLSPLIAAAPLAIAAVVDHLPEATKVVLEFHRKK